MWQEVDNRLRKEFTFKDFREAFAFMTDVAEIAERMDHHPTWTNVYNKVTFELFTFDAGNTVTFRDHRLAEAIDEAASKFNE